MSRFSTVANAYEVHRTVPKWMYDSRAPIVWRFARARWLLQAGGDSLMSFDRCRADIARSAGIAGLTHVGDIVNAILTHGFLSVPSYIDVGDHEALQNLIRTGRIPYGCPTASVPIPLEIALGRIKDLGYSPPATAAEERQGVTNAFAAAHYLATRRFSEGILFLTSRFIVPDPTKVKRTAHLLDQLWIARDESRDRVRLLALQISPDLSGGSQDRRQDGLLGTMGYEIFHASQSWALVDPQRVIIEFLRTAGIAVLSKFEISVPGATIKDYKCAYCRGPMIRTATREGLVFHRGLPFHEGECFNRAVNEGLCDGFESVE